MKVGLIGFGIIAIFFFDGCVFESKEMEAQTDGRWIVESIESLQTSPTTKDNLQERSQQIKQLLKAIEQKKGTPLVDKTVDPKTRKKFQMAMSLKRFDKACTIADEVIGSLGELVDLLKEKKGIKDRPEGQDQVEKTTDVDSIAEKEQENRIDRDRSIAPMDNSSPFGIFGVFGLAYQQFMRDMGFTPEDYWKWAGNHCKTLGAKWSRENTIVFWGKREPVLGEGYQWNDWDDQIIENAYKNGGDDFNLILVVNPARKDDRISIDLKGKEKRFSDFVEAAVKKYNKVKYWQAFNEPFPNTWTKFGGTADTYIEFLRVLSKAVKSINPEARVILGADVIFEGRTLSDIVKEVISKLNGEKLFDIVDIHTWGEADYWKMDVAGEMRSLLDRNGYKEVEIWSMEHGTYVNKPTHQELTFDFQTEEQQARSLIKRYVYNMAHGVNKIFWNNLVEWDGFGKYKGGIFDNMGLISDGRNSGESSKKTGIARLAYYSYRLMTDKLAGSDFRNIKIIKDGNNGIYVYKFDKHKNSVYVGWAENSKDKGSNRVTLDIDFAKKAKLTDSVPNVDSGTNLKANDYPNMFETRILDIKDNQITFSVATNPVFVEMQ